MGLGPHESARGLANGGATIWEMDRTTYRHERGDLLAVLDELDTDTLADGRVGLLGLNADLLEDDAFCVGRASSGGGLVDVTEGPLLVRLVRLQNE